MAQTEQDLQDAITAVGQAISEDAEQDQLVITAIEALIAKISASPAALDFTSEVSALAEAAATLHSSNAKVKTELDKVAN